MTARATNQFAAKEKMKVKAFRQLLSNTQQHKTYLKSLRVTNCYTKEAKVQQMYSVKICANTLKPDQ